MNGQRIFITVLTVGLLLALMVGLTAAQGPEPASNPDVAGPPPVPQVVGTAFTYQGRLLHDGLPVNDTCDFEFRLFFAESGSSQVGDMVPVTTDVNNGLFTAQLDFGSAAFSGEARWLGISVTCAETGPSGVLSPRQRLTPAPYALAIRPGAKIADDDSTVRLNRDWTTFVDLTHKAGVYAEVNNAHTFNYGVYGSAPNYGVFGHSDAEYGHGVFGKAAATSGPAYGVFGVSDSPEGAGVYALAAGEHDPDLILGGRSDSNDNGVIFSDPNFAGSDIFIRSNDEVGIHLNRNGDADAGHLYVYNGDGSVIFRLDEQGGVLMKDDEGQELFNLSKAGGAQFNTGGGGLRVNGVPMLNRAQPPDGNTITRLDSAGDVGSNASITIGTDGLGLISYHDWAPHLDLKVAHCNDVACTSATITTLDSASDVGWHTSVTIGVDGLGLISYYDDEGSGLSGSLKVAHCNDVACTSATLTTLDSAGNVGMYTSVTIGTDGLGLISYHDASNDDLKAAHCNNVACTSATINTLDSAGVVGEDTSITIGADGLGLISYYGGGDLKVAHCNNVTCSSAAINTPDSTGYDGEYTSITIGADGLGLISYYGSGDLKVAHCNDITCSSAAVATLDSAGDVGSWTSVTIGADGLGLISYYDETGGALKVAHCNDTICSSAATYTLDGAGDVGKHTAITIGADGLPLISYHDDTSGDLKVVHCSNPFCVPYFRRR